MTYPRFIAYNVVGGLAWVALFSFGGYFFGNLPVVQQNFFFVILVIIFISILPAIIELIRSRMQRRKVTQPPASV
jgi:membrane-associated protein